MPIIDLEENDKKQEYQEQLDNQNQQEDNIYKVQPRNFKSQEEMKTSTLFHKDAPLDTIIQYIRGMKWYVTYFLQLKDVNETLNLPDINLPPTTQKYNRINKLMLTIQSAIQQDNIENITGEAIVNAGFLPNVHDVFLVELTGGREAIFSITEVQTRTYNLHQAYYIQFKLFCFVDTEPVKYNDLVNKTMKEYVYDKEHLLDFSAPVILQSDYNAKISLKDTIPELLEYYLYNFVNYEKNVIALPTKTNIYTDTMLIDFLFKIVNHSDHHLLSKLTNLQLDMYKKIPCTIWDVIINRDIKMMKRVDRNIGFKYTPYTFDNLITKKMNALRINFIASKLNEGEEPSTYDIKEISIDKTMEYVPPIDTDYRKYVLSENFYNMTNRGYGLIEKLLMEYLNGTLSDSEDLRKAIDQYPMWDTIDQFYLIPILMVLVKDASSKTFKSL